MIEIDGSHGEGGGALLRIAAALSAVTGKPIKVNNIRSKRPKPGLMAQHLNALKSVAQLSSASYEGLEMASTEIIFKPHELDGGEYNIDIKTAGSTTLVLQSFLIPAAFTKKPVKLTLRGGTDVRWSPPFDYLANVTQPILRSLGLNMEMELIQRGYYPKGGGIIEVHIDPVKRIKPFNLSDLKVDRIRGISHAVKLPEHVAIRQARAARDLLEEHGYHADIEVQHSNTGLGPGSGIVLWTEAEETSPEGRNNSRIGGSSLGKPGKKAEIVGEEASLDIINVIKHKSALDRYMGDQIIPYMALAGNSRIKTAELTQHTLTNIYVAEKITGRKFEVTGELNNPALLTVD